MSSKEQKLANIARQERAGLMTPQEARDEEKLVRLLDVADSRRARLNAPGG